MTAATVWDLSSIEEKFALAQDNFQTILLGYAWDHKTISFSFPLSAFPGTGSFLPPGEDLKYSAFEQSEIDLTIKFLDKIERFLDIDFVYDASGRGELKFGKQNMDEWTGGYAAFPTPGSAHAVVLSDEWKLEEGSGSIGLLIHELGHALGLEHPHAPVTPLSSTLDVTSATMMSYNDFALIQGEPDYFRIDSYMLMDVMALQSMYGQSKKVSDDVYIADGTISVVADYGGDDTIDISTQSYDQTDVNIVDLSRGFVYYDRQGGNWSTSIMDPDKGWTEIIDRTSDNGFYNMIIAPGTTIEKVVGSSVTDWLTGSGGNETLFGRAGEDRLAGGAGEDVFVFDTAVNKKTNVDEIVDFEVDADLIQLDSAIFSKLGGVGALGETAFLTNLSGKATDRANHIIYEADTGKLNYDADGSAKKAKAIPIAVLEDNLDLSAQNFLVI